METKSRAELRIAAHKWARVDLPYRLYYLESCRTNLRRLAPRLVEKEAELRGHSPQSDEGAESWLLGPVALARTLRYLIHGLKSGGRPKVPSRRLRIDGRSVSRVFPCGLHEEILFWGTQAHVWSVGSQLQGSTYRKARDAKPGPALILGASNVSSIAITDMLSKLFCENRPVICKIPPRLAPLTPIFKEIFHLLVRDGHVQIECGDAELGRQLLELEGIETVHLTGSAKTAEMLLAEHDFSERQLTAELGCVTPAVIVPGAWTQQELLHQARHLASLMVINGGYNCMTPQILVLSKDWSFKGAFLRALRAQLESHSRRDDLFPGVDARREDFRAEFPQGECFGPRTLVELKDTQESRLFREEAFCGMLGVVELEQPKTEDFLAAATRFCNKKLWGDLSCLLLCDPRTRQTYERPVARCISALEYGTVGVNVYTGLAFASGVTPWGSYLGGKADTGNGWVHNNFFFDRPEKTVIEGAFIPGLPQPWIKPFANLAEVGPALFELELEPSAAGLARFAARFARTLFARSR